MSDDPHPQEEVFMHTSTHAIWNVYQTSKWVSFASYSVFRLHMESNKKLGEQRLERKSYFETIQAIWEHTECSNTAWIPIDNTTGIQRQTYLSTTKSSFSHVWLYRRARGKTI
jgi:hypothetical protein